MLDLPRTSSKKNNRQLVVCTREIKSERPLFLSGSGSTSQGRECVVFRAKLLYKNRLATSW